MSEGKKCDKVYRIVGEAVAGYIILHEEMGLIKGLIKKEYDYYDETEIAKIISYCGQLLDGNEEDAGYKKIYSPPYTANRKSPIKSNNFFCMNISIFTFRLYPIQAGRVHGRAARGH